MSWQTLEERELDLDPSKYTKKPWRPEDYTGYHKQMGPRPKTNEEKFVEENGWGLVDENDEKRFIERAQDEADMVRTILEQSRVLGQGAAVTEQERKAIQAAMMKRLSGI